jgi:[CysO sulfur-carrier protein]-S-L-cysteine hydrolase
MTAIKKDAPLSITPLALEVAARHAIKERTAKKEACGFIVGRNGVGERVIPLLNHHEQPMLHYRMSDTAVLEVFAEVDRTGEDVVAHYHSHPFTRPLPSDNDLQVKDHSHGYLIIGFDEQQPRAKAYRMDLEAIGVPRATEVLLHLAVDGEAYTPKPPQVAWSLTEGNTVRLQYVRHGHTARRSVVAIITRSTPTTVYLKPERPGRNIPQSLPVTRILHAEVLNESAAARHLRNVTAVQARRLAQLISQGPAEDVAEIVEILAAAYPLRLGRPPLPDAPEPPATPVSAPLQSQTGMIAKPVIIG